MAEISFTVALQPCQPVDICALHGCFRHASQVRAARAQRSSKYIEGLLDKAKERQREQDIVYERR
jgi:Coiled-coil domain-containing protein 55 (DUF2040)